MTEAMNFFQSLFSLNNFTTEETIPLAEKRLVRALIKDAKSHVREAEGEALRGETALRMMREAEKGGNHQLNQDMARIAVWHFIRSIERYRKASARYGEAGRVQTSKSRIFFAEARAMTMRADHVEETIETLNNFLKQS